MYVTTWGKSYIYDLSKVMLNLTMALNVGGNFNFDILLWPIYQPFSSKLTSECFSCQHPSNIITGKCTCHNFYRNTYQIHTA